MNRIYLCLWGGGKILYANDFENVQVLVSSTNNIVVFDYGDERFYFRECKKHIPKDKLIESIILEWEALTGTSYSAVLNKLHYRKAFLDMGIMNDVDSKVYQYFKDYDPTVLGFNSSVVEFIGKAKFDSFIHYAWSEILAWRINKTSSPLQMTSANRILCQEQIYKLFDVDRLICHSDFVTIKGFSEHQGVMMHSALGVNPIKINRSTKMKAATPSLHRELTILNVMDVLCYERDHRPGNYHVLLDDDERMISVQAFDNDSVLTFSPIPNISKRFVRSMPLIDKNGLFSRAHLDEEFAQHFLSVTDEQVISASSPYINKVQQWAIVKRFHKLKKAITKKVKKDDGTLVPSIKWDGKVVADDLKIGPSYYSVLLEWEENQKDPILLSQGMYPPQLITL